jgi:hypothetical protein
MRSLSGPVPRQAWAVLAATGCLILAACGGGSPAAKPTSSKVMVPVIATDRDLPTADLSKYRAFLVSDRVDQEFAPAGGAALHWVSDGDGGARRCVANVLPRIGVLEPRPARVRAFCTLMSCRLTLALWRSVSTMAPIIATSSTMPASWK